MLGVLDGVITIPFPAASQGSPAGGTPPARAATLVTPGSKRRGGKTAPRQFIAGTENHLAVTATISILEHWGSLYNPLVLYGAVGTGKSLLATGIISFFQQQFPAASVVYLTAADFARRCGESIETGDADEFAARIRAAELLVIEDIHLLAGKFSAQEHLIRVLDHAIDAVRQVVVTVRSSPAAQDSLLPGLRSRLLSGLAVRLALPGYAARRGMLYCCASEQCVELNDETAMRLATEAGQTFRDLRARLLALEQPLSADQSHAAHEVASVCQSQSCDLSTIARRTAGYFGLRCADLCGTSRRQNSALARAVAMYLSRELTDTSFARIGHYFGGRNHSTVMHAWRKIKESAIDDLYTRNCVEHLRDCLRPQ